MTPAQNSRLIVTKAVLWFLVGVAAVVTVVRFVLGLGVTTAELFALKKEAAAVDWDDLPALFEDRGEQLALFVEVGPQPRDRARIVGPQLEQDAKRVGLARLHLEERQGQRPVLRS